MNINISIPQLILFIVAAVTLLLIKRMRKNNKNLSRDPKRFFLKEILKIFLGVLFFIAGVGVFIHQQFLAGTIAMGFGFRTIVLGVHGYYRILFCLQDFEEATKRQRKSKLLSWLDSSAWTCDSMLESWGLNKSPH